MGVTHTSDEPKIIYEKVLNGNVITNLELQFGIEFFQDLADKLNRCGPQFRLAANEANRVYMLLSDFHTARREVKTALAGRGRTE